MNLEAHLTRVPYNPTAVPYASVILDLWLLNPFPHHHFLKISTAHRDGINIAVTSGFDGVVKNYDIP
jgi:hypothetical protein